MGSSFGNRLAKVKANWKKASERESQFGEFPLDDGRFIAKISLMEVNESMSSGRLQVHTEFEVVEGPDTGTSCHSYEGLESEDNLFYLQRKLAKMGQEVPDDPSDLEEICKKVSKEKPVVRIRVKTKGEFTNVYVDRLISESGDEGGGDAEPEKETTTATAPGKGGKARKESTAAQPPPEPAAETAGEIEIEVGDKVTVNHPTKGKILVTVTELNEEAGTFKAKTPDGKIKTFSGDDLVAD